MDVDIYYTNNKLIGKAILLEDGFYHLDLTYIVGLWDEYSLRWIADKLEELNQPYRKQLEEYIKEH